MPFLRRGAHAPPSAQVGPDPLALYRAMARARAFELLLLDLWEQGLVSGELHLGTGEEAIAAGVCAHLREGDALALDHRGTPWLLLRGVDPVAIVRELLGAPDGLCGGMGGHMHLLAPDHLAATSGIVGSCAATAAGFALAARRLRPGSIALATLGDGAMNQGMVLETLNLAVVWHLPLLLVCKDNSMALTTAAETVTAGDLTERVRAFGLTALDVDGLDPVAVYHCAEQLVSQLRRGGAPAFLRARCSRLDGHMPGFLVGRLAHRPLAEGRETLQAVAAAAVGRGGAGAAQRAASLAAIGGQLLHARSERRGSAEDPLVRGRQSLSVPAAELDAVDAAVAREMRQIRAAALPGEA